MRLATQKVLVHNMKCIETLARVDVLCVDKTGTITDNTMSVKKVIPFRAKEMPEAEEMPDAKEMPDAGGDAAADAEQTAVSEEGEEAEPETTEAEQEALELAIGDFAAAMATDNITMKAIKDYFQKRSGKRPGEGIFLLIGEQNTAARYLRMRAMCSARRNLFCATSMPLTASGSSTGADRGIVSLYLQRMRVSWTGRSSPLMFGRWV